MSGASDICWLSLWQMLYIQMEFNENSVQCPILYTWHWWIWLLNTWNTHKICWHLKCDTAKVMIAWIYILSLFFWFVSVFGFFCSCIHVDCTKRLTMSTIQTLPKLRRFSHVIFLWSKKSGITWRHMKSVSVRSPHDSTTCDCVSG